MVPLPSIAQSFSRRASGGAHWRRRTVALGLATLAICCASAQASDGDLFQRTWGASGGEVVLRTTPTTAAVMWADGVETALELGSGVVASFALGGTDPGNAERFWVAGSRPSIAAGREGQDELFLWAGDRIRVRGMRLPGSQTGQVRERTQPAVLVSGGALVGLAWLEGSDPQRREVWAAAVRGAATVDGAAQEGVFERPIRVAAAAPGTQTGLDGTVLADGSWLLAWSAFDGQDDEIRIAARQAGTWQVPEPLTDNEVPDIQPRVAASSSGAAIAWSGFVHEGVAGIASGGYRLHLGRRSGGVSAWRTEMLPALGAHRARWSGPPASLRLLSYRSWPREWTLAELDVTARVTRTARIETAVRETPVVRLVAGDPSLSWSGERSAAVGWQPVR